MRLSSWVPGYPPAISFMSLYPELLDSSSIPLSYSQSSDDSDAHSSSGGGSVPPRPPSHGGRDSESHYRYTHADDPPYMPGRGTHNFQRGFVVAPEPADGLSSDYTFTTGLYHPSQEFDPSTNPDIHPAELEGMYGFHNNQPQDALSGMEMDYGSGFDVLRTGQQRSTHDSRSMAGRGIRPLHRSSSPNAPGFYNERPTDNRNVPTAVHPNASQVNPLPDAGDYLRRQLNLQPDQEVNLYALGDPPNGARPSQALPVLVKLAIYGSPRKMLTLQEIYQSLEDRFEYYRVNRTDKAWKNSIRHNLSLNQVFRNIPRPITEPGKGSYWVLDISNGEGYKRERKRRPKNGRTRTTSEDDISESSASPSPSFEHISIDPSLITEGSSSWRRRTPSSSQRTSPYPGGSGSSSRRSPGPSNMSSSTMRQGSPSTSMGYPHIDPPPSQPRFGQTSLAMGRPSPSQTIYPPSLTAQSYPPTAFSHHSFPPIPTPGPSRPSTVSPMHLLSSQPSDYESGGAFPPSAFGNAPQLQASPSNQYPNQLGSPYPTPDALPPHFSNEQLDPKGKSRGF